MAGVEELKAAKDLEDLGSFRGLVVAHFWTPWSEPCKQMNEAMEDLAKEYERVKFFKVNWNSHMLEKISRYFIAPLISG